MKKLRVLVFLIPLLSFKSTSDANLTVVSEYFNLLFKRGDFVSLEKIVAKDAIYNQAEGLPYGGTYIGLSEWTKMFGKVQTYFEVQLLEDPVLYSNTTTVVANFRVRFKSRKTARELVMPIVEIFEFRNGIIASITPYYYDTKTIAAFASGDFKNGD